MGEPVLKSSAFGFPIGVTKIPVSLSSLTEVDVNGLPRLPLSVTCYARFRQLSHIRHPNLCRYLDAVREKGEIISVISEYYSTSFYDLSDPVTNVNWLLHRFYECLSALAFMNDNGLVHSCLTPEMIMLDPDGHVKIGGYGIFYGTEWCDAIDFVLHNPVYSAPEVFLFLCNHTRYPSKLECSLNSDKCWVKIEADVWSLGLIFFEIIHSRECANPLLKSQNDNNGTKIRVIEQLLKGLCQADHYPTLPEFLQLHLANNLPSELATFDQLVRDCLRFNALIRPSPRCLMKQMDKLFISNYNKDLAGKSTPYFQKTWNHSKRLEFQPHSLTSDEDKNSILKVYNFVNSIKDLSELYYYWKLTGGRIQTNVQSDVKSIRDYNDCRKPESIKESESVPNDVDFTYLLPPILRIPHYLAIVKSNSSRVISSEEQWPSNEIRQPRTFQLKITPLSSRRFIERISRTPLHNLYPLLICRDFKTTQTGNNNVCAALYSFSKNNSNRSVPSELLSTLRSSVKHNPVLLESNKSRPDFLNLLFTNDLACDLGVDWCMSSTNDDYESNVNSISQQPLSVRETDVDYQIVRTRLFTRILNGLPATKQYLRLEARKDIPPFLRWKVWAALLEVYPNREFESSYLKALYEIRKLGLEVSPTDEFNNTEQNNDSNKNSDFNCDLLDEKVLNQISVDLPRCHAYDPLLASPVGQSVLRRVLIATLLMKPGALDYTQGMDSIAAVLCVFVIPMKFWLLPA
ncbi:unnamed protein product [Heterobilharzia americana]|nr:unnamed protein product [Heterobilharzia americana]